MIFFMISLLLCAADLVLKAEARTKLPDHGGEKRITKHLAGRILYNRGFAMGKAEDRPDLVRGLSFAAVIIYFMQIIPALRVKGGNLIKAGCALTLGGALGNLTERLGSGSVTDYASLRTGKKIDSKISIVNSSHENMCRPFSSSPAVKNGARPRNRFIAASIAPGIRKSG